MELGDRIKYLREKNKFTREELAYKLNITYPSLSKYETNQRFPDRKVLSRMANFFNVSLDYLLGRTDIQNPNVEYDESDMILLESIKELNENNKKRLEEYIVFLKFNQEK